MRMFRILPNSEPSTPTFVSGSTYIRAAAVASLAVLAASCGSAGSGQSQPSGHLTGYLILTGGLGPNIDKNGHATYQKIAGPVTVFDSSGKPIAHTTILAGQPFHFTLPPGHYQLNVSSKKVWIPRSTCKATPATVYSSKTTTVNVGAGCALS